VFNLVISAVTAALLSAELQSAHRCRSMLPAGTALSSKPAAAVE